MKFKLIAIIHVLLLTSIGCLAQTDESLRIFGYFQNGFYHETSYNTEQVSIVAFNPERRVQGATNSFNLQQLNLFFQKDISREWRAFLNFEFLNTFSSFRDWGAFNLEEAWLSYSVNQNLSLKFGLLIPVFNHLNEIKNRTPLIPYVIRPLVYETSFSELIPVEEYTPSRAFAQAYGFIPVGNGKFDFAFYVGNSPNINNLGDLGQTGVDTTDTFLFGGRGGVRIGELKLGISATMDRVNYFQNAAPFLRPIRESALTEIARIRLGADLSYHRGPFSLNAEAIQVTYDDNFPEISLDREFYYATLSAYFSDQFLAYLSYWITDEDETVNLSKTDDIFFGIAQQKIYVPTLGTALTIKDRVTFKTQVAKVRIEHATPALSSKSKSDFFHLSAAISVFF